MEMRPAASGTKMAPGKRPKTAPATAGKRDDDCPKEKRRATAVAPSALPFEVKKFEDDMLQLFVNASNEPQSDYGSGGSTLLPVPEDAAFEPMINIEAGMVNQLFSEMGASPALDKGDCAHGGDWTSGDKNMDGRDDDLSVPPRIFVREDTANILHCVQTQDRWAGGITHLPDGTTTRIGTSPPQTPLSLPADTAIVQIPVGMRLVQVTNPSGEVQLVLEHEPAPPRQQTVSAPLIQRGLEPTPLLDDGAMQLLQPDEHQQARLAQIRDRRKNSTFTSTMRYAQRFVRQQEALQQSHELTLERSHPNNDGETPQK
ncbi:hypothetical protein PPROV_000812400 [Pycnococcus provasolii]|uniref:Uncharacterized protein n=1 Tax=Pycnococcus provasolii TaxID=41880 RepID=A0A830HWY0_9CHLO|nr:hypothetical protein PPROV_000812400 [Pycnococcus provasolii]